MSDIRKIQTGNNQYTLHARVSDKLAVSAQVGSPTKPVYVDSSGQVQACSRDIPTVDSAISNSSTNPIQNKAVFEALKLKADAAALDKYQPKYKADYIAKEDLSELPITKGVLDLNGHSINASFSNQDGELTIQNGTILKIGEINDTLNIINCTIKNHYVRTPSYCQIIFNNSIIEGLVTADDIHCCIFNSNVGSLGCDCEQINIYNSIVNEFTCYSDGYNNVIISNSYISTITYDPNSQPISYGSIYLYNCAFETLDLDGYLGDIEVQLCSCCDYANDVTYVNGYYDKTDGLRERALGAYQPKYNADYVATSDFDYSELPADVQVVDLNGYTITISTPISDIIIYNGEIKVVDETIELDVMTVYNAHVYPETNKTHVTIVDSIFYNCHIDYPKFASSGAEFHFCTIDDCIFDNNVPIVTNSIITDYTIIGYNSQQMINVIINQNTYKVAIIKDNKFVEAGYASDIYASNVAAGNAPSCEAVKTALQLKADKTQLNSLATKTELNGKADKTQLNNYVTTATANSTYAKKSDITNIYKFKGTKTNYADLPTTDRVTGDVWNITNADAKHGIKAGDNVAWNGTAWDNLSGTVDLSAYATKDIIVDVRASLESTQTDFVDLRNKVKAMPKTVFITQAAYNALTTKDANTIYYING